MNSSLKAGEVDVKLDLSIWGEARLGGADVVKVIEREPLETA